jgi:peptide/nickel transport system substrate-binding protein
MTAILVRNPNYAGAEPVVRRLIFQTIDDFNARLVQVQSGQLALALDIPPRLLGHLSGTLVACSSPRYGFISLPLNVGRPPLDEVAVRRAIGKAIDREQIKRTVWAGRISPIAEFWPSIMDGYNRHMPVARDIAGARRELQGTSCRNGCSVRLMYSPANPWGEPTAIIVAQNLQDIGIDAHLEQVDDATFNERLGRGDFQIAVSFLYDYNDIPDGLLTYALRADGGLRANFSGFQAPADLTRAMDTAVTTDGATRTTALAEVNRLFLRYQPFVTLSDYAVGCVSRYASSVVSTDASGYIDIARRAP